MILSALLLPVAVPAPAAIHSRFDVVDDLLGQGQAKLVAGDVPGALELFQQANGKTNGEFRTELWVLRAQMENGRANDVMVRLEELERTGDVPQHAVDYLQGSRAYYSALQQIRDNVRNSTAGLDLVDAAQFLGAAVKAAPDAYTDAWRNLATAQRMNGEAEAAAKAVAVALEKLPKDPTTHGLAAQIFVAQAAGMINSGDEVQGVKGREVMRKGLEHAAQAARLYGDDKANASKLAEVHLQRGVGHLYLEEKDDAAGAYAAAMAWDPTQVDFGTLWNSFQDADQRPGPFVEMLTKGAGDFEKRWGKRTQADAQLLWWLGYGEQILAKYESSEKHFLAAVEKWPAYTNSWWYAGLSRYHQKDYAGAIEHWRTNWAQDSANLVASVTQNQTLNDSILQFVEGQMMGGGKLADAVFIGQVRCGVDPTDPVRWNNLGLFCRDQGDALRRAGKTEDEHKTVEQYYELAWEAYSKAMELDPGKPYYMNDGAVILHYCLDREHQKALDLYAEATAIAEKMLAAGGLDKDQKGLVEIALRDSKNNRERLVRLLEQRKKDKEKGDGDSGGN